MFLYFDLCEHIWGGSPATEQIFSGVESIDIDQEVMTSSTETALGSLNSSVDEDDQVQLRDYNTGAQGDGSSPTTSTGAQGNDCSPTTTQHRRELLGAQLSGYKKEKLKRKLPVDSQLFNYAKEDLQLKKKLFEQMDQMDRLHNEHMKKLSTNMEQLTSSIASGFSLFQGLLYTPPQHIYQQTGYANFNPPWQGYNPGHFPDYHHGPSAQSIGGAYSHSQLQDPPEMYRESTSDQ